MANNQQSGTTLKAVSERPESEIPSLMGSVVRSTSLLDERISVLLDRLIPVLRESNEACIATAEQRASTIIGCQLQDHRTHIDAIYERVNDALSRLEL